MSIAVAAVLLGVAGIVGAAAVLSSRDDATLTSSGDAGQTRAPGARPAVQPGNVLLLYADERQAPPLRALRRELTGSDPALADAGQAVLVERDPRLIAPVVALSARHRLAAREASEPALRDFVEYWLGRALGRAPR